MATRRRYFSAFLNAAAHFSKSAVPTFAVTVFDTGSGIEAFAPFNASARLCARNPLKKEFERRKFEMIVIPGFTP
jgi:hypothetical protein